MGKFKTFAVMSIAGVTALAVFALPAGASAWHPEGTIVKKVQNVTQNGAVSDANDGASAVSAKPGDTLNYVITVANAQTKDDGNNDMTNTVMTDTLPDGVELVGNASQRTIVENLGTIKPNQSVTKQYQVKVTSQKDGELISNKACFTGNTAVNDNPQNGCDVADVKVSNPPAPEPAPTPAPTPPASTTATPTTTTPTPTNTASLPSTGPTSTIIIAIVAVAAGYAFRMKRLATQES